MSSKGILQTVRQRPTAQPAKGVARGKRADTFSRLASVEVNPGPLLALMCTREDDVEGITEAIRTCPALSARLLSVINSAAFGMPRSIDCIERAVLQLGPHRTRTIALAFALRVINEEMKLPAGLAQQFWINSLRKASAAKLACQTIDPQHAEQAYCHGLLQDIGLPVLIKTDEAFYTEHMLKQAAPGSWNERESDHFGVSHAEVGHHVLQQWGVPTGTCEAVLYHHNIILDNSDRDILPRMANHIAALIPHFNETQTLYERQWTTALHAQFLSENYATPEKFLLKVNREARKLHGSAPTTKVTPELVNTLTGLVAAQTQLLVRQLYEVETLLDQSRQQSHEFRFASLTDPLTQLLNRRGFFELGAERLQIAREEKQGVILFVLDLDHFKEVNDAYGHDVGDRALRIVSQRLRNHLREDDLVARIGGDEFVAFAVGIDEPRARVMTQNLHERCSGIKFDLPDGSEAELSFSLGAVFCDNPDTVANVDELMNEADEAMYERKRLGKNGFVFRPR